MTEAGPKIIAETERLILRERNEVIGMCGVSVTVVDGPPTPELGYRLIKSMWGKGYAMEAGRATLDYWFNEVKLPELMAFVEPANAASVKVLEKLGFTYLREASWHGKTVKTFRKE
ncbi:MAG: ynaD [Verrucomicrobia bacterium]|jgi:RimJ/RimL family protein N-acetyltransferase|nr:ynaD [Verrucomicrobiota bacterium]